MYHLIIVEGHKNMLPGHIIFKAESKAQDYYSDRIPEKDLTAIKNKHGFTPESWVDVLQHSYSFYFLPTPEMDACNKEIKSFMSGYTFMNGTHWHDNYFYSELKNEIFLRKNPSLTRVKINGLWHYSLTDKTISQIEIALKPKS